MQRPIFQCNHSVILCRGTTNNNFSVFLLLLYLFFFVCFLFFWRVGEIILLRDGPLDLISSEKNIHCTEQVGSCPLCLQIALSHFSTSISFICWSIIQTRQPQGISVNNWATSFQTRAVFPQLFLQCPSLVEQDY